MLIIQEVVNFYHLNRVLFRKKSGKNIDDYLVIWGGENERKKLKFF